MIQSGEIYKNKKNGNLYQVDGLGINCTNAQDGQEMVLYHPMETGAPYGFCREISEFKEKFDLHK